LLDRSRQSLSVDRWFLIVNRREKGPWIGIKKGASEGLEDSGRRTDTESARGGYSCGLAG
jgi:hypothetical protein